MIVTVILFCVFVVLFALGGGLSLLPWGLPVMLCAVFAAAGAITSYMYWTRETNARINRINAQAERDRVTEPILAQDRLIQHVIQMTPEQQKLVSMFRATITVIANPGDPNFTLTVGNFTTKSWETVEAWHSRDTPTKLPAIGWWSEGTEGQNLARAIVAHMVANGFAEEPAGNQPAKWIRRKEGLRSIWLEE